MMSVAPTSLAHTLAEQNELFGNAFAILRNSIVEKAFPAAVVAITHQDRLVALNAFGNFTYQSNSRPTTPDTIFDLASVTKVVATTAMAMLLYERGLLDLDSPVISVVPEFTSADKRRGEVTFRMLLTHSSGLPAYERLFLKADTRAALVRYVFAMPLVQNPGYAATYSDIGFILLGVALERIAGEPLDRFCQREVFGPLGMTHTGFCPPVALHDEIPPTIDDQTFRHRIIQGEVYDENASVLGGIAPHAGLFSTAEDVALFAHAMLKGGRPILRPETVGLFTRRELSPPGTSRALGWDTPSQPSLSGQYLSANSYGH